jgi:hypothetical protein
MKIDEEASKIAQDVILRQIKKLKEDVGRLESVTKDYFLWLESHGPTLRAPDQHEQSELCTNCGWWAFYKVGDGPDYCARCGTARSNRSVGG